MPRLVTFGCSHVYGLELDDCLTVNDPPSKLGFSTTLSNMLGREELNRSDTGASSKQITATVLETEFRKTDIVVINWSIPSRRGVWNGRYWEQLASWQEEEVWQRFFAKYQNDYDECLDFFMNDNLANYFLKNRVSQTINSLHTYNKLIIKNPPSWNNVNIDIVFKKFGYYKALKDGHPNKRTHDIFAKRLFKLINE